MVYELLRTRNQSQQLYVRGLTAAYRVSTQVFDPSLWRLKDPEAEEKMRRDADIGHVLDLRRSMVAGRSWDLVPRAKNSRAEMALHVGTELISSIKKFTEARRMLVLAILSGQRYARIHGEHRKLRLGDGKLRTWYVPTRLEDMDMRTYRQVVDFDTRDPQFQHPTAHWERWDVFRGEWIPETLDQARQTIRHTYDDDQASLGYGRGLLDALGWWWYAKTHIMQESIQAAERYGQGIIRAKVDGVRDAETGLPNTELMREWEEALEEMRARHVLVHDSQDEVDIIQASGTGWGLFKELREEYRNTIATLFLGATMNTTATQGGSYALAEVHQNTTEELIQFDRQALEETITDDLIVKCLWYRNHANLRELGIHNDAPRFNITQDKAQDPQVRVQVAATAVQMGLPLSRADVYDQIGFRAPEDGEDLLEPQQPAPGGMPGGGGFPFYAARKFSHWTPRGEPVFHAAREFDESKVSRDQGKFAPHPSKEGLAKPAGVSDDDRSSFDPQTMHWGDWSTSNLPPQMQQTFEREADAIQGRIDKAYGAVVKKKMDRDDAEEALQSAWDPEESRERIADAWGDADPPYRELEELDDRMDSLGDSMTGYIDGLLDNAFQAERRAAFGADWDESKVKRDGGKFAPKEGAGADDSDSADKGLAALPAEARDWINGDAPMQRQDVSDAERAQADQGVQAVADSVLQAMDGDGPLAQFMEPTGSENVSIIREPSKFLKVAVGAGILPAAMAWNVGKSYAGLIPMVLSLPGKAKAIFTAKSEGGALRKSLGGMSEKIREGLASMGRDIKARPVTGAIDAAGTSLIALPLPFSLDAGLAIKGIAKTARAFDPSDTATSIKQAIRKAFLRQGWNEGELDVLIAALFGQPIPSARSQARSGQPREFLENVTEQDVDRHRGELDDWVLLDENGNEVPWTDDSQAS